MSYPIIKVTDLWKFYPEAEGEAFAALRGVNMEAGKGEIVALFGKSGSGKTTLLNLLAGLDRPSRGSIEIEGRDLASLGDSGRTQLRRRRLGFVFQFFNLIPTLTVFENVYLSLELAGRKDRSAASRILSRVGLAGKEKRYPHELSGGEQQRVALARALVKEPALILADEPTGNLDTQTGNEILHMLTSLCRASDMSMLMVTHTVQACTYADRLLRMTDGVITEERSPSTGPSTSSGQAQTGLS